MPIVRLASALKTHADVWLWADDPATESDLKAFCDTTGHQLEFVYRAGDLVRAHVRARKSSARGA